MPVHASRVPGGVRPGYPVWIWYLRPGPDYDADVAAPRRAAANSVDLDGDDLAPVARPPRPNAR